MLGMRARDQSVSIIAREHLCVGVRAREQKQPIVICESDQLVCQI